MQCHVCGTDIEAGDRNRVTVVVDHFEDAHGLDAD